MKKYSIIIVVTLLVTSVLSGCKKNNGPKDYTSFINEKTWWGTLTYNGQQPEYYSVHFNADNTFTWSQLSGDYPGKWSISGNKLDIKFTLSIEIKADIGDDHKLSNITDDNPGSTINSGEWVENPNIPLDNTVWTGTITQLGVPKPLLMLFTPGPQIGLVVNNVQPPMTSIYSRSASGGSFRVNTAFFGVITSTGEMKGTSIVSTTSWSVKK